MVQSPSWATNWLAASPEIPHISRNPKVHYRTHKRPPPVSIPGQPNPIHIPTSHLLEIHPNIINPSTPTSPHWSLSLRFPHQDPINPTLLTHTRHMRSPSHCNVLCCYSKDIRNGRYPIQPGQQCLWEAARLRIVPPDVTVTFKENSCSGSIMLHPTVILLMYLSLLL
jgi:hypothetical protein